jgi:hypothetical protein
LERIAFRDSDKEAWLQEALNGCPEILPVAELDASFAPLVSLGREILNIDNLFVSPSGRITLVETKLWRNPGSTRTAIAQIMDYAQKLRELSYDDLEGLARAAKDATLKSGQTIYQLVSERYPDETEAQSDFIDSISKTLRSARFMLLIVGDGIKENLEGMVGLLQTQPQMLFTFGLVELQVYGHGPSDERLIVPQVVAHSTEIVRAVVKVKTEGKAEVTVSMESEAKDDRASSKRITINEAEFYEATVDSAVRDAWQSIMEEARNDGFNLKFASKSVSLCVSSLHVFRMTTDGKAYPHSKIGNKTERDKQVRAIIKSMRLRIGKLFGVPCNPGKSEDVPTLGRRLKAKEVSERKDDLLLILRQTFRKLTDEDFPSA